ncbi:uncharacterized protein LOC133779845 [Humulus lupulus]|uniref:uncharacterized protein LOC133779845 n=1 Tax=Humulus lupulus TaxID=3486 RepID=UPI002B411A02|nr:uncharacterized protein LOC133779845 [Humulus lupulus]
MEAIQGGQLLEPRYEQIKHKVRKDMLLGFHISENGMLGFKVRICVPDDAEIKKQIFYKENNVPYAMHPIATKMVKHHRPAGLLKPLKISEWKWEMITMDFFMGLRNIPKGQDTIWVIVDRLTKSAHFLPIKITYLVDKLADLYIAEIEAGERKFLGIEEVDKVIEDVEKIQERLRKYADRHGRPLAFEDGDKVLLKVAPLKGAMGFGKKGKLSPRYIRHFEIVEKISVAAYRLALLPALAQVHDVFHVSILRKYVDDLSHVLSYEQLEVDLKLCYEEKPVRILNRKDKVLCNKTIPLVKLQWWNHGVEK